MGATKIDSERIAKEFNLPKKTIEEIYMTMFEFIHKKASEVDWVANYNNVDSIKHSFVIPEIGKLYLDKDTLTKRLKEWKKI